MGQRSPRDDNLYAMDFNQFKVSHSAQLKNIPEKYWDALFDKLSHEVGFK